MRTSLIPPQGALAPDPNPNFERYTEDEVISILPQDKVIPLEPIIAEESAAVTRESLTVDFDDTLNKYHEGFGIDPRLLAIIKDFGHFTIVTHRSFRESTDAASKGFSAIFDKLDEGSISGFELALFKKIFIPSILRKLGCRIEVCYANTPREGFGPGYTQELLKFEKSLFDLICALYARLTGEIPNFGKNIIYLINYIRNGVQEKFKSQREDFLRQLGERYDFSSFHQSVLENFDIDGIYIFATELLEGFSGNKMLQGAPDVRKAILEKQKVLRIQLVEPVADLIRLFLREQLVTAFEQSLQDGYDEANRLKQKQFEYVMQREGSQRVLHIDDNRHIAGLKMEGVTVLHYQPNCTANGEFLEEPHLHEWFGAYCKILSEKDPERARLLLILHSEEAYALAKRLPKILRALEENRDISSPDQNRHLYTLFFQCLERLDNKFAVPKSENLLEKDKCLEFFIGACREMMGRDRSVYLEFMIKFLLQGEILSTVERQFSDIYDISGPLMKDVGEYFETDFTLAISRCIIQFYRNVDKTPEEFLARLTELFFNKFKLEFKKPGAVQNNNNAPRSLLFVNPETLTNNNNSATSKAPPPGPGPASN